MVELMSEYHQGIAREEQQEKDRHKRLEQCLLHAVEILKEVGAGHEVDGAAVTKFLKECDEFVAYDSSGKPFLIG